MHDPRPELISVRKTASAVQSRDRAGAVGFFARRLCAASRDRQGAMNWRNFGFRAFGTPSLPYGRGSLRSHQIDRHWHTEMCTKPNPHGRGSKASLRNPGQLTLRPRLSAESWIVCGQVLSCLIACALCAVTGCARPDKANILLRKENQSLKEQVARNSSKQTN